MNALALKYLSDGELHVSSTVATLEARAQFAKLRRMLSFNTQAHEVEVDAEIDRLVDHLADVLHSVDGFVTPDQLKSEVEDASSEVGTLEERLNEKEEECENLEADVEKLERQVKDLQSTIDESEDELRTRISDLIEKQQRHDAEIERMGRKVAHAEEGFAAMSKAAARDRNERMTAETRMAAWSSDKTAAETADHYREKYELATQRESDLTKRINSAFVAAHHDAGKRKAVHEGIDMVHNAFMYGPKGAKL